MENQKKNSPVLIVLIVLIPLLIISGVYFLLNNRKDSIVAGTNQTIEQKVTLNADLTILDQNNEEKAYKISFEDGQSLFDALLKLDNENESFSFNYSESSFGAYITSINGYEPDASKAFWKIQINGEDSQVGVSDYKLKEADSVKFLIDEIVF